MEVKPIYQHDCDWCVFLGRFQSKNKGGELDIYWCSSSWGESFASILGRFGNDGSEYYSGGPPESCSDPFWYYDHLDYIRFALAEAKKRGLYNGKFGGPDDRAQALKRLKLTHQIYIGNDILTTGSNIMYWRQPFLNGKHISWKEALELIRKYYPRKA